MKDSSALLDPPAGTEAEMNPRDDALAPALEPQLPSLLTRLVEDHESDGGSRLRLPRLEAELVVEDWDGPTLLDSVRHPEHDEPEPRALCSALCLLLKADEDLAAFDARGDDAETAAAVEQLLREDAELHERVGREIKAATDTAVLRGRLRSARVLSRFQQGLPPLDAELSAALQQLREEHLLRELEAAREREEAQAPPEPAARKAGAGNEPRRAPAAARFETTPLRPRPTGGRWMSWPLLFLLATTAFGLHVHRQLRREAVPAADSRELRAVLDLVDLHETGALLHGTVSERWRELDYRTRAAQFERLTELAAEAGFPAVVLVDREGRPAARWSRDSVPMIYTRRDPT